MPDTMRMVPRIWLGILCASFVVGSVFGLGTESFGSADTGLDGGYEKWKNLDRVIEDTHRVYFSDVNGGERACFKGNAEALNEALIRFSKVEADVLEVVFLPGPRKGFSLGGAKTFAFDWKVEVNTGVSEALLCEKEGKLIWSPFPQMTVYIGGGGIELEKVQIPEGINVLEMSDLRKRCIEAISTSDQHDVRGWGAGHLAALDSFSDESHRAVAARLKDKDEWVRSNAVLAIAEFGKKATTELPLLRQLADATKDKSVREWIGKSIASIEKAREDPAEQERRSEILKKIHAFREKSEEDR